MSTLKFRLPTTLRCRTVASLTALSSLVLGATLSACSDPASKADADAGPAIDGAGPDADTRSGEIFTASFGPFDVQPGIESTQCVITRVNNDRQVRIGKIENQLGATSHHYIIYRIAEGEVTTEPFECQPFVDTFDPSQGAPLMVTQKSDDILELPGGVAFTFEPNQLVRLELHYVNATDQVQQIEVDSTFTTVADADFEHEADFLFIGNPDIEIPANQSASLQTNFLPIPADMTGIKIFGVTGHTHQWGTDVQVSLKNGESGTPETIYDVENFLWDEPETVSLSPEIEVQEGDGFEFRCEWTNGSDATVGFGEGVNDEMCFFWAYYYPSVGSRVCVHSDQYPDIATDLCCPGDALCALIDNFL